MGGPSDSALPRSDEGRLRMRVIAGQFKRRPLLSPSWKGLRPTSDRLRESLFAIVGEEVVGARVLDGCAGSGALGIEALSRGAAEVVFVERDARAIALICRNLALCDAELRAVVMRGSLPQVLDQKRSAPFDLILLDPPYGASDIDEILTGAASHLAPSGAIILERSRRTPVTVPQALVSTRQVRTGSSALEWFERVAVEDENRGP